MSDKVIVSKKDLNDLPYVEQEHSGDKYVLLEDIKHWLEDATPVSVGAVAEVRCRNNEVFGYIGSRVFQDMLPLGTKLYTTPQPAPDTVPREKYDKLMNALNSIQSLRRYFDNSPQSTLVLDAYEVGQIIAEAMKGE